MSQLSFARSFTPGEIVILEAYLRLCFRNGVDNITLAELAKESAVAFGTVHSHFGGAKRAELPLCAAIHVARTAQEFTTRMIDQASARPGYHPLTTYISAHFAWARHHDVHASYWVHHLYLTSIRSKLREINSTVIARGRKKLETILFEAAGRGCSPQPKDSAARAAQVHSLLIGGMALGLSDPSPGALDREERIVLSGIQGWSASSSVTPSEATTQKSARHELTFS